MGKWTDRAWKLLDVVALVEGWRAWRRRRKEMKDKRTAEDLQRISDEANKGRKR